MKVSVAEAQDQLAEMLRRAEAGEEVEVTRDGRPVARLVSLVPETPPRKRSEMLGALKGKIWIAPDFDDPLPEFEASINAPIDPPDDGEP